MRTTDKYGFRSLKIGEFKWVTNSEPRHAQQTWYRYRQRYPNMRFRQFLWWRVNGGIRVERVG